VRVCLLIPIYNHKDAIGGVLESLAPSGLHCFVVDDGSDAATREVLDRLAERYSWVEIEHLKENGGKGAALKHGYRLAAQRGYTHALQLDADGQHDPADVPRILERIARRPEALVLGQPIFDASAPWNRLWGRKLSVGFVWLTTLSRAVRDPLCGFRGIPLEPTLRVLDGARLGDRMDFDPDLAVRLVWQGVPVESLPTRVRYVPGGLSHFDVVWDDLRLAWLYLRLTGGMLRRAPGLLARRRGSA